ncbi:MULTISPECIES: ABC transporter permease subunit [Paenibacillus]|uniref:Carbohydrate ABC transporter membrane protein 1 (CUT1 family) n=1 Tax=Paenibacillus pabuli TaxID=1472 RepID=A0A855Y0B4_9BACL|nr:MULTISPECIES: ABC transporter permease subunit [Paenibacillus]OAX49742.1 putative multiple-sugar transport system permease YteP [Paenibacillus sp. AD87]PWW33177.1 carbohydrate ABC transporter membrane protein 1 (CUT1 family) [Paenibacillus pabuli]PXV99223.1 carbohydrate ABC transporter membrane protein 1 (CUT1 family) [Paenibacillus taichungensis]RAJ01242.1 carbohydrate ABC transporter membrane protein 1 (CUT1 family) [Paenibacillus pabuli]WDQ35575.1 ABC transporter permease subunit [Paenib
MHKVSAIKTVRSNNLISRLKEQKWLFVLMLPAFIATLLFSYGPMFGLYMAFTNYQPGGGSFLYQFFHAEFVGFQWFEYFFTTGDFYRVMRNTLATSLLTLFFGFPAPIILALVLNEARQGFFKRFVQTVSYLPHFISWVIAANIVITLLASDGMLNNILVLLGIVKEPVAFLQNGPLFWWIIALSNMWKEMGFSAIMYLAAIASINPELYEAARVDGASRFKQMWHITLPSMRPTIVILAILAVGGILNAGFEQQYLLQNNTVLEYSEVIDIYAYKYGLQNSMFSYGAAVGMFKSVVAFILVLIVNRISRKVNDQALF